MKALNVFIGANYGKTLSYFEAAKKLGEELAGRNITLIYGGSKLGLMGVLADTVLANGGKVIGVITKYLYEQEAHLELSELCIVESMQERKKLMMQLADGFLGFPGGLGTLEEIFEVWNAAKLKIHDKPLGLLNIENYFNKLIEFIDHSIQEGFFKREFQELIIINDDPIVLLDILSKEKDS